MEKFLFGTGRQQSFTASSEHTRVFVLAALGILTKLPSLSPVDGTGK